MDTETQLACTKVEVEQVLFKWTIENFGLLTEECSESVPSPVFHTKDQKNKWKLRIFPRGHDPSDQNKVALYVIPQIFETLNKTLNYECSIYKSNSLIEKRTLLCIDENLLVIGCSEFTRREKLLSSNNADSTITVCCKIRVPLKPYITSSSVDRTMSLDVVGNQLFEDFGRVLEDQKHTDITVFVGSEQFPAHKIILAARSPVFSAMFDQKEMTENVNNKVIIEDTDPSVVKAMLEFMYTDRVTDLESVASRLLIAAEKYDVERLRNLCEDALCRTLDKENAVEILVHADLHHAERLKGGAMRFIVNNFSDVLNSDGCKKVRGVLTMYPELLMELMEAVANWKITEADSQRTENK